MSYLKFSVQNQFFVLPIFFIDRIIPYVNPIEFGYCEDIYYELINLKGKIIPCLDFSYLLNKKKSEIHLNTRIILLKLGNQQNIMFNMGLIAESVIEIIQIDENDFLELPINVPTEWINKRNVKLDKEIAKEVDVLNLHKIGKKCFNFESRR